MCICSCLSTFSASELHSYKFIVGRMKSKPLAFFMETKRPDFTEGLESICTRLTVSPEFAS